MSLGDGAAEHQCSLPINSKSAHWGERGQKKNRKGQQRHALLSPFHPAASFSSHLAPSTPGPAPATDPPLPHPPYKHKATRYSPSLDCVSVFCKSSALQPFITTHSPPSILYHNHSTSSRHCSIVYPRVLPTCFQTSVRPFL